MRNDPVRLAQLRRCLILDSSAERAFDDVTRLLATHLEMPITIVNLLDADRDWFKSCFGLPQTESPASTSFCEEFFNTVDDVIVVEDTSVDARFASHPLVVGAPHIRCYAAARLVVENHTLGTLCAYDVRPRKISTEQVQHLRTLASAAVELIRQRPPLRAEA